MVIGTGQGRVLACPIASARWCHSSATACAPSQVCISTSSMMAFLQVSRRIQRGREQVKSLPLDGSSCFHRFEASQTAPMPTERTAEAPTCSNQEVRDGAALSDSTEQVPREPSLEDNIRLGLDPSSRLCSVTPGPRAQNGVYGVYYFLATGHACLSASSTTGACRLSSSRTIGFICQCCTPDGRQRSNGPHLCCGQARKCPASSIGFLESWPT